MCGICGKLIFSGAAVDKDLIVRMQKTLVHRGPDDEGVHVGPYIGLGQRRLSIIDLSASATAPLANEDETIWVVFNGEIYNFQALREELEAKGHVFRTRTDTEVLPHLYEEMGTECVTRLRGMFAFALWDARRRVLFAARDRIGKKPFCYARTARAFVFGSEIKAVTADPEVSVGPNYAAIDQYLRCQCVPSPLTAFEGVCKLPPAHYLLCGADGTLTVRRYWQPPTPRKSTASPEELEEEILERLREAVRMRMVADVPLGAFLSGGIDSTTVVALMAQESDRPVRTFSIGFDDASQNELPWARLLAERYGTDHHEVVLTPNAAEVLPLLVRHYNEPFADSSAVPTYYVSKMTRRDVTVALTGDGGDESFAGYNHYGAVGQWARLDPIPFALRRGVGRTMAGLLDRLPYTNRLARVSRAFAMLGSSLDRRYRLNGSLFKPQEREACYTAGFKALLAEGAPADDPLDSCAWTPDMDPYDWMMRHDQMHYLPDCLMVKTDIASMANSLEVRCPFLDHEFMEFAATIPSAYKRDGNGGKRILRSAVRQLLPEAILTKPKTGFSIPLGEWLRTDLRDLLRETLLSDRARRRGLFEASFVAKMIDDHTQGRRDYSTRLWALLFLELWFREFID